MYTNSLILLSYLWLAQMLTTYYAESDELDATSELYTAFRKCVFFSIPLWD